MPPRAATASAADTSAPARGPSPSRTEALQREAAAPPSAASGELTVPTPRGRLAFRIAYASDRKLGHLPTILTAERLNQRGWAIKHAFLDHHDAVRHALATRKAHLGALDAPSALEAAQAGSPTLMLVEYERVALVLAAKRDIEACSQLQGARLAIHAARDAGTTLLKRWLERTCRASPRWLLVRGADNRVAALLKGQIDAAPLPLSDWTGLRLRAPDRFRLLVRFADALPEVKGRVHLADRDWLEQHREVATAFLAELLRTHRLLAARPGLLDEAAERLLPQLAPELRPEIVSDYLAAQMFPLNGGLTTDSVAGTIRFLTETGRLKPGLEPERAADLSPLEAALGMVGAAPGKP